MSLTELRKYGMGFLLIALLLFVICGCGNVGEEEGGGEEDDRCRDRRVPSLQLHRREWKEFRHRCRARAAAFSRMGYHAEIQRINWEKKDALLASVGLQYMCYTLKT